MREAAAMLDHGLLRIEKIAGHVGDFWCGRGIDRQGTRASLPLIGSDGGARRLIHYERSMPIPAARARMGMMPHLRKWRR